MPDRITRRSPYRPFTAYMPRNLKVPTGDDGKAIDGTDYFDPLNAAIDLEWGGSRVDQKFNNYYDYFFSGEDVKIFIDGLFEDSDELDIAGMAFVIKQEKQPLYGFWSYNYDAVMLGTRLITGEISIYSRYPRRMTEMLEKAAAVRMESSNPNPSRSVISTLGTDAARKDDELNIQKYWLNTELDRTTADPQMKTLVGISDPSHNIFSAHPPFNLIIFYGLEESGITNSTIVSSGTSDNINSQLNSDRILATDYNERNITSSISSPMKIVLQNVNLMAMSTSYESGGRPLVENYQFIARDMYFTDADLDSRPLKGQRASVVSILDTPAESTSSTTTITSGTRIS
jgi:hypothetical protein